MIFEFAQKSFPTQYLLPFYRFERIFNLSNQPLFHPDENDSPSGHNNALSPGSALRLQRESPKLPPISIIQENLLPSISARHHVMDGTGKLNPRRS
jgi:hypothetical protein